MRRDGKLRVGISGWRYPGWRGKFYPKSLPHWQELEICEPRVQLSRDQRLILFIAVAIKSSPVALRNPSGFYFQRQRRAFHHSHEKTAQRLSAQLRLK
jgi:hypothetical protein